MSTYQASTVLRVAACLEWAIGSGRDLVSGGMSEDERSALKRRMRTPDAPPEPRSFTARPDVISRRPATYTFRGLHHWLDGRAKANAVLSAWATGTMIGCWPTAVAGSAT